MVKVQDYMLCENCFEKIVSEPCPKCGFKKSDYWKDPTALPIGSVLNKRYVIGGVIGKGGFGITYLAFDLKLESKIAIKEYYPIGLALRVPGTTNISATNKESENTFNVGAEKFYSEAKMIARFNGSLNIVSVYDFFYENDTVYFTMGYLQGETLKSYLKHSKLNEGQAVSVMQDITNALLLLHSSNVLHRDISPDNIMICNDGSIKLLDFGAARQVTAEQSQSLSVILKQGFAPLEQYQKKGNQGPWTDIYALGATIYNALTGEFLDDPMTRFEDDSKLMTGNHGMSDDFWSILKKCIMLKIEDRYNDVFMLKKDLNALNIAPIPIVDAISEPIFPAASGSQKPIENETVLINRKVPVEAARSENKQHNKNGFPVIILLVIILILLLGIGIGMLFTYSLKVNLENTDTETGTDIAEEVNDTDNSDTEELSTASAETDPTQEAGSEAVSDDDATAENASDETHEKDQDLTDITTETAQERIDKPSIAGEEQMLNISYAEASSELNATAVDRATYHSYNLHDGDYTTAWVDGVDGSAAGETLVIHLNQKYDIARLKIYNGYLKTRYRYTINGKAVDVLIDYGNGTAHEYRLNVMDPGLDDVPFNYEDLNPTEIVNDTPVYTDTIKITILSDIPGTKYYDTAISELEVYGYISY